MTVQFAANGDIDIAYETFGPPDGQPLLLIMGIGGQMLDWRDRFCHLLVERGFTVARFDNRDAGLSTRLTSAGRPNQLRMLLRPATAAVYQLGDMADDALAVLDALGWSSAHLVGVSQGGMIAQTIAARHPDRARSLVSISSTPDPHIGRAGVRTMMTIARIANPKRITSAADLGRYLISLSQLVGSPAHPADHDELRQHANACFERGGVDLAAMQRQTAAIAAAGDRRTELAAISAPTVVIHGEADPLIRPEAGAATAEAIPGATLVTFPGMGHDLPPALWPAITDQIAAVAGLTPATHPAGDPHL